MIRRSLTGVLRVLACFFTLLILVAVLVRFTVQDRAPGLLMVFFASPWPIISAGSAICAVYWFRCAYRFTAAWLTVVCLMAFAAWLSRDWEWRAATDARGDFRLVHWNIDRPDKRLDGTMRWLAAQDADLISIAEREPKRRSTAARWHAAFPGYQFVPQRGETLLLVRGEVLSTKKELRKDGSFATSIRTRIRGREVTVLQVDINGTFWLSRKRALGRIAEVVRKHRAENLILVGDFNTPRDSAYIEPLRREMTNAFEKTGSGCAATWPVPVPVLSLDQVWLTPSLKPVRCEQFSSWRSDHRAVVTEINFVGK